MKLGGIVGYDYLRRTVVELDPSASAISVFRPGGYPNADVRWEPLAFDGADPVVHARFEGDHDGWFRIDSGAGGDVTFHTPAVQNLKLLEGRETAKRILGGVGGFAEARTGKMDWFEIGGQRIKDIKADFALKPVGSLASKYLTGNIGQGILERFRVVYDYDAARVAFIPKAALQK